MKKGQVLIIVIIILSVFIAIIFSLASIMATDQTNQRRISNSQAAYYAAESGLEHGILQLKDALPITITTIPSQLNGNINSTSSFSVQYSLDSGDVVVKSTGRSGGVLRKLETRVKNEGIVAGKIVHPKYWIESYQ